MSALSLGALTGLPEQTRPAVDPRDLRPRVVHLGLGAFHRAHQAVATEAAAAASGEPWGIVAVAPRDAAVVAAARAQDGLFSVTTKAAAGSSTRVVGSLVRALHLVDDADALAALLLDPEVTTVTLTVTEKGYFRDTATGGLDLADPRIAGDLASPVPRTVPGRLAVSLASRYRAGGAPIDVVSCDNLAGNGAALARVVREYLSAAGEPDAVLEWLATSVGFPDTVVDRIVPATTDDDLDAAAAALGVTDALAVAGEPYSQWVLQDAFKAARPPWEAGGAQFVDDVSPFQLTKLRLLNGCHSGLAYLGLNAGLRTIADTMTTPWGETFVRRLAAEVAPTLPPGGPDPERYAATLLERFANPAIRHELRQVGTDGSLKLPQRYVEPLRELRARRLPASSLLLGLAAWAHATRQPGRFGAPDPAGDALTEAWGAATPEETIGRLLRLLGAPDLADDQEVTHGIAALLPALAAGCAPI